MMEFNSKVKKILGQCIRQAPAIKEKLSADQSFNYRSSRSDLPPVEPSRPQPDERTFDQAKVSYVSYSLLNDYANQMDNNTPDRARQNVEDTAFGWEHDFRKLVVDYLTKLQAASSDFKTGSQQTDSLAREYIAQILAIIDPPEDDEFGQAGSEPVGPDDLVGAPA